MSNKLRIISRWTVFIALLRFIRRHMIWFFAHRRDPYMRDICLQFLRNFIRMLLGYPVTAITMRRLNARSEGGGSQVLSTIQAMDFAARNGLTYLYVPFQTIVHGDRPMPEWVDAWENLFNLGLGEARLENSRHWFINAPPDFTVLRDCNLFSALGSSTSPEIGRATVTALREKYYTDRAPRRNAVCIIAVHIRRGDVTLRDHPDLWVDAEDTFRTVRAVADMLMDRSLPYRIKVYSQDDMIDLSLLAGYAVSLHADLDAIATMREMIEADILIATKSTYSFVAGIYCDGAVLSPDCYGLQEGWIALDDRGEFIRDELARKLDAIEVCSMV